MKYQLKHCPPNPTIEYAESIIIPDGYTEIESIGGGSTIDVGKWLSKKYGLRHIAIPTTAGTGSEVTKYCVLTVDGKKKTFTDKAFIPSSYVLNPSLVTSLPKIQTISTGLDALSQSFESLWSKNSTNESREYARVSISLIMENLPICVKEPENEVARMNMLIAANMSGRAINQTRTNVCHAISYPLTDVYNVPHGIACAMSLGYFCIKALNININNFLKSLDIPLYSFDIDDVVELSFNNKKLKDCPFEVTKQDISSSLSML